MYPSKSVGNSRVIPVADKQALSEENIGVAAFNYLSGVDNPLESKDEQVKDMTDMKDKKDKKDKKETAKEKARNRGGLKFVHKMKVSDSPETAPTMDMYLRVKQMSLFPSIY